MKPNVFASLLLCAFAALFAGCSGQVFFSPEAAAVDQVSRVAGPDMQINQGSIKVMQTVKVNDSTSFVLLSYQGTDKNFGQANCTYSFYVDKSAVGWNPGSGGGGCTSAQPLSTDGNATEAALPPVEWNSGATTNGPMDPGRSDVTGMVHSPDVTKVRITWSDGLSEEVGIVNNSFVLIRSGQFSVKAIEAFDAQDNSIYQFAPEVAPGKMP